MDRLFEQLDDYGGMGKARGGSDNERGRSEYVAGLKKSSSPVNNLSELLMEELRKSQFESYKEKGYHQGLKDKTYQIKIELKSIFRNFSPD